MDDFSIKPLILASFVLSAGVLSGCTTLGDGENLSEEPSYQAGYGDGCATGIEEDKSFSTSRTRDEYLFDNDRAYRSGWRQGFLSCSQRNAENESNGGLILGQPNQY